MKKATRKLITKLGPKELRTSSNRRSLIVLLTVAVGVVIALALSHTVGNPNSFKPVKGQNYHSAGLAMTATYPKGWSIKDKSTINEPIGILYATDAKSIDDQTDSSATITVAREPVDGNLDKVGKELLTLDSEDKANDTKIIKIADITIDNLAAKKRETTSSLGHEELIICVDSNNIGRIITIQTPESKWQSLQPAIQTFVKSIQFD